MKKKIFGVIAMCVLLVMTSSFLNISASEIKQTQCMENIEENPVDSTLKRSYDNQDAESMYLSEDVCIGSVKIIGDGTQEGSYIILDIDPALTISLDSSPDYVTIYLDYIIECTGDGDFCLIDLALQLFRDITLVGSYRIDINESGSAAGSLIIKENLEVYYLDTITYEVSAVYVNALPFFYMIKGAGGAGVLPISKNLLVQGFFERFFAEHPQLFPILRHLLEMST